MSTAAWIGTVLVGYVVFIVVLQVFVHRAAETRRRNRWERIQQLRYEQETSDIGGGFRHGR